MGILPAPASDVIRWLIVQLGRGSDPTPWATGKGNPWPVFVGVEPSIPDNCIMVTDTTGMSSGRSMPTGEVFMHYGFQVRVRGVDEMTSFAKVEAIRKAFAEQVNRTSVVTADYTCRVHAIANIGQSIRVGLDNPSTRRFIHTLNPRAAIDQL